MTTTERTYPCGRCGKRQTAARMLYSRWTHQRFCTDLDACAKRSSRRTKEADSQ